MNEDRYLNQIYPRIASDEADLMTMMTLLKKSGLPNQDLQLTNSILISYHDKDGNVIACGGLEFYANDALLRSIAVDETHRGKRIGREIVRDLIQRAGARSIDKIYLLTETARDFFVKLGFKDVNRDSVPDSLKKSSEFSSVCPISATCMVFHFEG
jgi:amino-acid N-acetyltransferase